MFCRFSYIILCLSSFFLLWNSIPLYKYDTVCSFIHLLMDIFIVPSFLIVEGHCPFPHWITRSPVYEVNWLHMDESISGLSSLLLIYVPFTYLSLLTYSHHFTLTSFFIVYSPIYSISSNLIPNGTFYLFYYSNAFWSV